MSHLVHLQSLSPSLSPTGCAPPQSELSRDHGIGSDGEASLLAVLPFPKSVQLLSEGLSL